MEREPKPHWFTQARRAQRWELFSDAELRELTYALLDDQGVPELARIRAEIGKERQWREEAR